MALWGAQMLWDEVCCILILLKNLNVSILGILQSVNCFGRWCWRTVRTWSSSRRSLRNLMHTSPEVILKNNTGEGAVKELWNTLWSIIWMYQSSNIDWVEFSGSISLDRAWAKNLHFTIFRYQMLSIFVLFQRSIVVYSMPWDIINIHPASIKKRYAPENHVVKPNMAELCMYQYVWFRKMNCETNIYAGYQFQNSVVRKY